MTLQLSGQSERLPDPHREFLGQLIVQMPLLVSGKDEKDQVVDVPRDPASFAYVLERRMEAPEDVKEAWREYYIFTGDGSTAGTEDDHLIVLEDLLPKELQFLRGINTKSVLYDSALVLPDASFDSWNELKSHVTRNPETGLYLTVKEVKEAHGQGYVKKKGVWTPANKSVGKVWETLSRGRDLTSYIQLVSEKSSDSFSLLNVYFNKTKKDGKPTMRSWIAINTDYDSLAYGYFFFGLDDYCGRLVGVAPVAREKVLEVLVQSGS